MTETITYSPSRACRLTQVPRWDMETDVAIVGFGAAGSCAAIEAAAAGARVTVFEVASGAGGSAALSGGEIYVGGGGGTPAQLAAGFTDATEDLYQYLLMCGGPDADVAKVRLYADNALAHYHWMEAQGVPYKGTFLPGKWLEPTTDDTLIWSGSEAAWPFSQAAKPAPRGHAAKMKGWGAGKVLMERLTQRAQDLGAEVHLSARVLALIADDNNHVHGLVVRIDGTPRFVRAKNGVILSAGGFVVNPQMVRQYAPGVLNCTGEPTSGGNDDGSGIRLGMSVGAAAIHMEEYFCTMPAFPPESLVKGIFVNQQGQRFINEDAYHGRVTQYILRQPNSRCWLLVDNEIFARPLIKPNIEISAVGETWEEVEKELGLPSGELVHTVEAFNRHAAEGEDPLFHKHATWLRALTEPPFAAMNFSASAYGASAFTLGGLNTLPSGQVLNADGAVIPGLYAAGRTSCGLPRWGEGYSSGMSIGDSTFFGRQAGLHAAKSAA